jgi:hypothetical protein
MSSSFDNGSCVPAFHTNAYAHSGRQLKVVVDNHVLGSSQPMSPLSENRMVGTMSLSLLLGMMLLI